MITTKNKPSKEAKEALIKNLTEWGYDVQFEISLCLSDLMRQKMHKSTKGKIYTDLIVGVRKEPDQWGRDLKVYETPTSEDRKNGTPKNYVGGGRMTIFVHSVANDTPTDGEVNAIIDKNPTDEEEEDIPF